MVMPSLEGVKAYRKSIGVSRSKPKPANHNPRAEKHLRERGYSTIVKVEHELAYSMRKSDLLGCDFLAISSQVTAGLEGEKRGSVCLIQVCSAGSVRARLRKMAGIQGLRDWLGAGCEVAILGYRKDVSPRGAIRWHAEWHSVDLALLDSVSPVTVEEDDDAGEY
jgi:hypothetical protein